MSPLVESLNAQEFSCVVVGKVLFSRERRGSWVFAIEENVGEAITILDVLLSVLEAAVGAEPLV